VRKLKGHAAQISSVAYSPDGRSLVSGAQDGTVRLWDVTTGHELCKLDEYTIGVWLAMYSPDGKMVASSCLGNASVQLWDVATCKKARSLVGHTETVYSFAYSADGKTLASGSGDNTVRFWDIASARELRKFEGHTSSVPSVAFSPDGKTLASASLDKTIRLWDVASGNELHRFEGHTNFVPDVAFSPDGKILASGSWDKTARLWDVATGEQLRKLEGHRNAVVSIAYSPDGQMLASSELSSILLHRAKDGRLVIALSALSSKDAFYYSTLTGHIDIVGPDACAARAFPVCRIGTLVWPFDVCEERFYVPDLYAKRMTGDTSYLEPEFAPALMTCSAEGTQ